MHKSFNSLLNNIKSRIKTIVFVFFTIFLALFFIKQSFAKEVKKITTHKIVTITKTSTSENLQNLSNSDIVEQIEKSLVAGDINNAKSTITIDKTDKDSEFLGNIELKQVMNDQSNRIKEKAAYNNIVSGQYEAALELYKQILKSEPNNDYAKFGLATSYHKLKQYKQAKKAYTELLSSNVDNKNEIVSNLLEILIDESPQEAKYILTRLSSQNSNADYILARTALTYDKIGNKDEAVLLLKRAIAINPNNMQYKMNLAIILDKNNEETEALKYYKEVLETYIKSGSENSELNLDSIKKRIKYLESL